MAEDWLGIPQVCNVENYFFIWGHLLSMYEKFSAKHISNPLICTCAFAYQGLEMLVFQKILRTHLIDGPFYNFLKSFFILFQLNCTNFNKDWNDGIKLASLVDSTAPGLFPEWEDLNPNNKIENAAEAMKRAEEWLGVPQVRPFAIKHKRTDKN